MQDRRLRDHFSRDMQANRRNFGHQACRAWTSRAHSDSNSASSAGDAQDYG
jgi:hypothetical protein